MFIDAIIRRMNNTEDQVNVTKTKGSNGFVTFLITIYSSVTRFSDYVNTKSLLFFILVLSSIYVLVK